MKLLRAPNDLQILFSDPAETDRFVEEAFTLHATIVR